MDGIAAKASGRILLTELSSPLIQQALERAISAPDGLPLIAGKQSAGLFPSGPAGKDAARDAQSAGLLRVVRTEGKGKSLVDICCLTEKGLSQLLEHSSPRPVLESLVQAIGTCQSKIDSWVASVAENRTTLDGLKGLAERVLNHLQKPEATLPSWARNGHAHDPQSRIVELLRAWQDAGKLGDCPLPELFAGVSASAKVSLGQFHDALRALHEQRIVYLHPWTGPLNELPHPPASLLVGHEIAYYASLRS